MDYADPIPALNPKGGGGFSDTMIINKKSTATKSGQGNLVKIINEIADVLF